ncbi:energy-coupling factor transporter transmembrane component T [Microbacterium capsulatum]|uniref:Energy-coupling factor transporter transmembrane component T n=1 Tax=Microbacterium capsulatum TaxID=3041921 RepID=A0ABU0XKU9_9MICO|nr:energy-coupling factor transporter transmembrane component T [Microbacterium sp. ASV81]MDQ4215769.1 energy-coupling factor transporter transmembrane component T [Microbacterium sp. ASV81]
MTPFPGERSETRGALPDVRPVRSGPIAPRSALAKLAAALIISLPLILSVDVLSAFTALVLSVPVLLCSGLKPREFWLRTAVLWIAAPLSAVTIALYGQSSGAVLFSWFVVHVTEGSVSLAVATALRVLTIGLPAIALFATVDPTDLADGLAQRLRLPARFVIGALAGMRMLGLLAEDWRSLALARRARGVADQGRIRRGIGMAFALFVLAVRRGSSLAMAMEARGFGARDLPPRTWARPAPWTGADTALVLLSAIIPAVAIAVAVAGGTWHLILGPA